MARDRKPLIEPGSLLPEAETLIGRILERDRQTSGRKAQEFSLSPAPESVPEAPPQSANETGNITSNITAHILAQQENIATRQKASNRRSKAETQSAAQQDTQPRILTETQAYAQQLAATRAIPITLRMPEGLNDWLDDYAHQHRKQGVKKQDLIARAVELLVLSLSISSDDTDE